MKGITGRILQTAIRAAREAGGIQKRHLGKTHRIRFKGTINLVTEVDRACEERILRIISREFPDHDILTEETGAHSKGSEYKWIVDPLDGTTNYAHGYPAFCVSIGIAYKGKLMVGVVYDPTRDELFWGVRGKGARLNGKRIRVSKTARLQRALLATGFAYTVQKKSDNNLNHFGYFIRNAQAVRRDGAAAIDICYVACGRFDGFWEMELWPWDTAAGVVILREAGGRVSMFDGEDYDVMGQEIIASNGRIHAEMVKRLRGRESRCPRRRRPRG